MKVRFYCDNSRVNIHSGRYEDIDLAKYWGVDEEERKNRWDGMDNEDKYKEAVQWALNDGFEIRWKEIER